MTGDYVTNPRDNDPTTLDAAPVPVEWTGLHLDRDEWGEVLYILKNYLSKERKFSNETDAYVKWVDGITMKIELFLGGDPNDA